MRNPFRFGPPISSADEFFGREQVIDELLSLLAHGTPCSIVGERRVGKTSLLLRIADPGFRNLVETRMGPVLVVYLDFQGHRDLTVETFWRVLIEEVAQQAQAQVLDERVLSSLQKLQAADVLNVSDVRRLVAEFARAGTRLIILFDEFEYVADSNALDLPFFGGLRSLVASNLPVTCITASRKSLSEIDRFASGYSFVSSPFFNVFTTFRLGAFEERAAIALLTKSLRGTGVEFDADDFEFLYELSGYHPFFLQMAAYYLFEESKKQPQVSSRERRLSARSRFSEQCHAHFDYYWSNSTDTEKAVLTAYALDLPQMTGRPGEVQQIQSEMAVRSLTDRVLLVPSRNDDGSYRLVSASLADWIREPIAAEARPSAAMGLTPEDFRRLPQDGAQFEALVRRLLGAMGYHLLDEPVAAADSRPDILAERIVKDTAIERRERVVVGCKHYAHSGKAISSLDVGEWQDVMTSHAATGYLLVTDTRVAENLARLFREFTMDEANRPRWAAFWDVDELIGHLNEYPDVRDTFLPLGDLRRNVHAEAAAVLASLYSWLSYNVIIPSLAIFIRLLVPVFLYGPASFSPASMLAGGEVVLFTGAIVADTLREMLSHKVSSNYRRRLVMIRVLLTALIVLSLASFVFPLASFMPSLASWLMTPEGREFLAFRNLMLLLLVSMICFWARWQHLTMDWSDAKQGVFVNLFNWLGYNVLIPSLAIFLRWLESDFLYGLGSVDPLSMLTGGEVIFLAGIITAGTLGETPSPKVSSFYHRHLAMIRSLLMVLLVLSLMTFGAFTPIQTMSVDGAPLSWMETSAGQEFLAWFNLALFLFVLTNCLWARWRYLIVDHSDAKVGPGP